MTSSELLQTALSLSAEERVKLAAELLASVAPGTEASGPEWDQAWLAEVQERERSEPDETLGEQHELPAVRQRLLGLFR